jgi:hypothetical protein
MRRAWREHDGDGPVVILAADRRKAAVVGDRHSGMPTGAAMGDRDGSDAAKSQRAAIMTSHQFPPGRRFTTTIAPAMPKITSRSN